QRRAPDSSSRVRMTSSKRSVSSRSAPGRAAAGSAPTESVADSSGACPSGGLPGASSRARSEARSGTPARKSAAMISMEEQRGADLAVEEADVERAGAGEPGRLGVGGRDAQEEADLGAGDVAGLERGGEARQLCHAAGERDQVARAARGEAETLGGVVGEAR